MQKLLTKFGVETTSVSFDNMADVESAVKPNTAIIYCEVAANPCMNLADIPACAELAHKNGAMLIVDNTFTTPLAIRPPGLRRGHRHQQYDQIHQWTQRRTGRLCYGLRQID